MVPEGNPHSSDVGPVPEESRSWKKKKEAPLLGSGATGRKSCHVAKWCQDLFRSDLQLFKDPFFGSKKKCWWREPRSGGYWLSWESELRHTHGNSSLLVWPIITRGGLWLGHNAEPHSASDMKGPFPSKCFTETQRDGTRPWRTLFSRGISRNNNQQRKKQLENVANHQRKSF